MTTARRPLPFTIAGRSFVDGVRLRWGGAGAVGFGIALLFAGEPAGIVFGILLALLGLATLVLSGFGAVYWYDIPAPQRYVVAAGAVVGFVSVIAFIGVGYLLATTLQAAARNW